MARAGRRPVSLAAIGGLILLIATALPSAPVAAQSRLEYSVKANYLVRFAAFVDWPPRAFATAESPVVMCVVGRDPFGGSLDAAARGKTAYGRTLNVRRVSAGSLAGCHIAYVGQGGGDALTAAAAQPGLLVVTDNATGTGRGAIHFVLSDGRVRFHIDQTRATRNGLTISSRLLNLALTVREG